ncbi:hypothetical protein [Nonomuraea soli]|uniref:Uncharacterized protein n=1 Tax=Nonomuraea soli TaxID=1032476 RepID=A0A7W0CT98_9ACTN|nr:hypothetical protein [Nonomuraea soli]MBA2896944.1 hypothetical protein [Nonomuraea soli]
MYFINRDWTAGPLSKTVRHFPGVSMLEWFQALWQPGGLETAQQTLGCREGRLESICTSGHPPPRTLEDLRNLIRIVWWADHHFRMDERSIRIFVADLWYETAYYFVEDAVVAENPERWSYIVHDDWRLPDADDHIDDVPPFVSPVPVRLPHSPPATGSPGATYLLVTHLPAKHDGLAWDSPDQIPGVRLPQLVDVLPTLDTDGLGQDLVCLQGLIEPGDADLTPALDRRSRLPADLDEFPDDEQANDQTLFHVGRHLAQMCFYSDEYSGYRQWFAFDDIWAASHRDLATSLVHYAFHWDPLCARRHDFYEPCVTEGAIELDLLWTDSVRDYETYDEPAILELLQHPAPTVDALLPDGEGEKRVLVIVKAHTNSDPVIVGVIGLLLNTPSPGMVDIRLLRSVSDRPDAPSRALKAICWALRLEGFERVTLLTRILQPRQLAKVLRHQVVERNGRIDVHLSEISRPFR